MAFGVIKNSSQRNISITSHFEVSSIVKWGYQGNFKPVYFFYEKISHAQIHSQAKINQQNKAKTFHVHKLLTGWKSFVLHFGAFCASGIFL